MHILWVLPMHLLMQIKPLVIHNHTLEEDSRQGMQPVGSSWQKIVILKQDLAV